MAYTDVLDRLDRGLRKAFAKDGIEAIDDSRFTSCSPMACFGLIISLSRISYDTVTAVIRSLEETSALDYALLCQDPSSL